MLYKIKIKLLLSLFFLIFLIFLINKFLKNLVFVFLKKTSFIPYNLIYIINKDKKIFN